jgi:cellobiose PTS system EIIB component
VPIVILPETAAAAADGEDALDLALEFAGAGS